MSTFSCPLVRVDAISEIAGADKIEVAAVGGYQCVVGKAQFKAGDYAVYIPEGSVVPEAVLDSMGLKGKLSGAKKDRVKAIKLRGILSQGLLMDMKTYQALVTDDLLAGDEVNIINADCAATLGIVKYEPPVPVHLGGGRMGPGGIPEGCIHIGPSWTVNYDIENLKKYPTIFEPGEMVSITEKLHGTFMAVGWRRDFEHDELPRKRGLIFSKGLGARGVVFRDTDTMRAENLYVRLAHDCGLLTAVAELVNNNAGYKAAYLLGEAYGDVQDLTYAHERGKVSFRAFDLYVIDKDNRGYYVSPDAMIQLLHFYGVTTVPVLYTGKWEPELAHYFAKGKSTLTSDHIREGCVIRPQLERHHTALGRVMLKSVSEEYLLRKEGTELS